MTCRNVCNVCKLLVMQVAAKFGNIFSLRVGYDKIVLVSGYEWVKEVLVTQGDYFLDRIISPPFKEVVQGNGEPSFSCVSELLIRTTKSLPESLTSKPSHFMNKYWQIV